MRAIKKSQLQFREMNTVDIDAVLAIEALIHSHPWTRGNFIDSLQSGHSACVMQHGEEIVGYAVMMIILDEAELLNLSVAKPYQKQGLGSLMLAHCIEQADALNAQQIFLEVRESNHAAIALYQKAGFLNVSVRRGYYPADQGREDAIIMRLTQ